MRTAPNPCAANSGSILRLVTPTSALTWPSTRHRTLASKTFAVNSWPEVDVLSTGVSLTDANDTSAPSLWRAKAKLAPPPPPPCHHNPPPPPSTPAPPPHASPHAPPGGRPPAAPARRPHS